MKKINIFKYLPSKKFAIVFLLVALSLAGGWIYFSFFKKSKIEEIASLIALDRDFVQEFKRRSQNLDSDNDELKDWEEALWKTDPNNPDSDADGYSDKQEVDAGFDPLDSSSNEKTGKKESNIEQFIDISIPTSFNLTDQLANNISRQLINKSIAGENVALASIIDDPLNFLDQKALQGMSEFIAGFSVIIPDSAFRVTDDNSEESFKKYTVEVKRIIFGENYSLVSDSEKEIANFLESGDSTAIGDFINTFDRLYSELKEVIVPSSFLPTHKQAVELMLSVRKSLEGLERMEDDPLVALVAIEQASESLEKSEKLMAEFFDLFQKYR